jgi:hypothetical protein
MKLLVMWLGASQRRRNMCALVTNVKKVETLFAHLKRILKMDRLRSSGAGSQLLSIFAPGDPFGCTSPTSHLHLHAGQHR